MQPDSVHSRDSLTASGDVSADGSNKEKVNVALPMTAHKSFVFNVNTIFSSTIRLNGKLT